MNAKTPSCPDVAQFVADEKKKMTRDVVWIMGDPNKEELPQTFNVRYLGRREARGLWGIRHTRKPVDSLVTEAKNKAASSGGGGSEAGGGGGLGPPAQFTVSRDGCSLTLPRKDFPIATISYGVQDLVYTRVFAMIVVRGRSAEGGPLEATPFECHGFACQSREAARRLTYCLAAAFQEYSDAVRATSNRLLRPGRHPPLDLPKFAIDLRTPEELAADYKTQDSEA